MAIEIKFSKSDINTPWGFRLTGGAECDAPLTVIKIYEGSIAENAGLQAGDVVLKINDYKVEKLTHAEAHDVIFNAGQEFILAVHRSDLFDNTQEEEPYNEEVSNIMEGSLETESASNFETLEEQTKSTAVIEKKNLNKEVTDEQIAEVISGETEVLPEQNILGVNFNKVDLEGSTVLKAINEETAETKINLQNKKWSTFLQKPKRSAIKPKPKEPEAPKAPPYRVVIKKQIKKSLEPTNELPQASLMSQPEEMEEIISDDIDNSQGYIDNENRDEDVDISQREEEEANEDATEFKKSDDELSTSSVEEATEQHEQKITETITTQSSLSLEDQLAQVQQQLQALAQLPSAIQVTLDAVTQQLAKIVKATHKKGEEETTLEQSIVSEDEPLEQITEEETLEYVAEEASDVEEETKLDTAEFSDISERDEEEPVKAEEIEKESETRSEENLTEEEMRMKQIEIEKQERVEEFHQRRLQQRPTYPLAPLQRPIVLPGGRKWSQPDDAVPAVRKPKMTDEKICETIETYSEVLTGRLKGINFLKYQPPPRSLDYLQNSEVFKLVHDMDPPSRGIASRPGKIASEQDYYSHEPHQGSQQTAVGI